MLQSLIDVILPVFLVIGAGYIATLRGMLNDDQIDGVMKFAQGVAIPCLLFKAIAELDLSASFDPRLLASFYVGAGSCFLLGLVGARYLFKRDWEDCVAIALCCLFSNTVLLGLPITERAYGPESLTGNYAIIAFHSPFCFALGITAMEIARNRHGNWVQTIPAILSAMFKNSLILGILLGFLVNISNLHIPSAVNEALSLVIRAALPTALFALGGVLVKYRPEGDMRAILFVCATSLMIHPALVWMMGTTLELPQDLFRSGVLTAAMATGFNGYIFASMYGRAKRVAASSVLIGTAANILTVWFWLLLLG